MVYSFAPSVYEHRYKLVGNLAPCRNVSYVSFARALLVPQTDRWAKACCHIFRVCGHTFCIWQSCRVEGQKRQLLYNIGAVALKKTCGPLMDKGPCVVQRNEQNAHMHFTCSVKNFDRRWWIFMCLPAKHTLNILNTLKYFTEWSTKGPKGYIFIS